MFRDISSGYTMQIREKKQQRNMDRDGGYETMKDKRRSRVS